MRVSQRAAGMPAQPLALHAADVAEVDRVFARSDALVPITIDPAARRLVLDSAAVTAQDIDHAWADWMLLGDNRKYPPAFTSAGGDDHGGALYIPAYNLLENDWRVGPMESAHDLTITGKLFVRGGGVPVFNTLGTYQINVNCPVPVQAQGIATSGGAGATAAEGWAYGSRTLTSTDCPTASAIADAVWSRDIGTATARCIEVGKPDGTTASWAAVASGTHSIRFDTLAGTLAPAGKWRLQARVTTPAGVWRGATAELVVCAAFG